MAEVARELLREAYLNPIRFALLVDDEFPAYGQEAGTGSRVMEMVRLCRSQGWLCDVENRIETIIDLEANRHLQQSDLLIVDFHLDPTRENDCTAAVQLLQSLAVSPHFNMALIYTGEKPEVVAINVAFGLGAGPLPAPAEEQVLSDRRDDGDDQLDFQLAMPVLKGLIGSPGYAPQLASAQLAYSKRLGRAGKPMLALLAKEYFAGRMGPEAFESRPDGLPLQCDVDAAVPWISTPNLFVAVVNKDEKPDVLLEKLCDGLAASGPTPLQVMVVQARAAMEKAGSRHDRSVLRSPLTQAGWLLNVLSDKPEDRPKRIAELYGHLFASLAAEMQTAAGAFGARVIGEAEEVNPLDGARALSRLNPDVPDGEVYHAANEFLCSAPAAEDGLLAPGVVFKASGSNQFWVCTTPSCDLVPGQNEAGWDGQLGSYKAVYAARLSPVEAGQLDERLRQATYGRHIFLTVEGRPVAFEVADEVKRQARLEVMFVADEGQYASRRFAGLLIRQAAGKPSFREAKFEIVAKLRAGYSAKFLMDAGMQKARIGLDWLGMPQTTAAVALAPAAAADPSGEAAAA